MNQYTATEILKAFKNFCHSRGYTTKVVNDWRWQEPIKRGKIGNSCKLWSSQDSGRIMEVYDTKIKNKEYISTGLWL